MTLRYIFPDTTYGKFLESLDPWSRVCRNLQWIIIFLVLHMIDVAYIILQITLDSKIHY